MFKWISVEEDIPGDNIDVIVHYSSVNGSGDVSEYTTIGRRMGSWSLGEGDLGNSYWDIDLIGIDNRVLHWMHLPPIPEKNHVKD